jgi:hypothetical protein
VEGDECYQYARQCVDDGLNDPDCAVIFVTEHCVNGREKQGVAGKSDEGRCEGRVAIVRIDVPLQYVTSNLRVDPAIVRIIVRQAARNEEPEAKRYEQ